jgi:hypothetical protein
MVIGTNRPAGRERRGPNCRKKTANVEKALDPAPAGLSPGEDGLFAPPVSGASFTPGVSFGSCIDSSDPGSCGTSVLHNSNAITVFPNDVGNDRYFIDDFRISEIGNVPEPASLALLGVASTAVGFSRRSARGVK